LLVKLDKLGLANENGLFLLHKYMLSNTWKTKTFADPLEQFNIFTLVTIEDINARLSTVTTNMVTTGSFHKVLYETFPSYFYIKNLIYYTLFNNILKYVPAEIYLLLVLFIIGLLSTFWFKIGENTQDPDENSLLIRRTTINASVTQMWGFTRAYIIDTGHFLLTKITMSILKSNTTLYRKEFYSILMFLFIVILFCNIFGLFPYTFTLSSSFIITFFLAGTHYTGINIIGLFHQKIAFANLFLPSGVPLIISPFLVIVEFISYLAKVLSLSIRLFANMMSGHALLKILIGFS
jgi:ATP synthase subunit 6